jgi:hypothetical protein
LTAEIAIMNRSAVALAADSAVTFGAAGKQKIYNTVHKLFSLSKYHPVGIMIFGNAGLMSVPWETIIKMYRKKIGKRGFDTLKEYVADFLTYLESPNGFFPENVQDSFAVNSIASIYGQINSDIQKAVQKKITAKEVTGEDGVKQIVADAVAKYFKACTNAPALEGFGEAEIKLLEGKFGGLALKRREAIFENLPMEQAEQVKLHEISVKLLSRRMFSHHSSGIVIAGFGGNEFYPGLIELAIDGLIINRTRRHLKQEAYIGTAGMGDAAISPFAQVEMVQTFMEGVDPNYRQAVESYLRTFAEEYPATLLGLIPDLTATKKDEILKALRAAGAASFKAYNEKMGEYRMEKHVSPVLDAIGALPKDELAAVAESLVNLTSFKRRFSMDAETVGGAIDVAVISKGDGFVWIKRKHYFKPELNPAFFANYFREYNPMVDKGAPDA